MLQNLIGYYMGKVEEKKDLPSVDIVKFYPFEIPYKSSRLVAYLDVKIGELLVIRSVKLLRNRYGGLYVQMPSIYKEDKVYPLVDILSKELLEKIRRVAVDYYNSMEENT